MVWKLNRIGSQYCISLLDRFYSLVFQQNTTLFSDRKRLTNSHPRNCIHFHLIMSGMASRFHLCMSCRFHSWRYRGAKDWHKVQNLTAQCICFQGYSRTQLCNRLICYINPLHPNIRLIYPSYSLRHHWEAWWYNQNFPGSFHHQLRKDRDLDTFPSQIRVY